MKKTTTKKAKIKYIELEGYEGPILLRVTGNDLRYLKYNKPDPVITIPTITLDTLLLKIRLIGDFAVLKARLRKAFK